MQRQGADVITVDREQIERDVAGGQRLRQLLDPRRGRVQTQLQGVEVEALWSCNDDLAVHDNAGRQRTQERIVEFRKVAIQRPQVAALDVEIGVAAKDDGAEAVPLRLVKKPAAGRQLRRQLGQHRL